MLDRILEAFNRPKMLVTYVDQMIISGTSLLAVVVVASIVIGGMLLYEKRRK